MRKIIYRLRVRSEKKLRIIRKETIHRGQKRGNGISIVESMAKEMIIGCGV